MSKQEGLQNKKENFIEWYIELIQKAELADYSKVRGFNVIRPYAYEIWERLTKILDSKIKEKGVKNAYFPLLIPESLLKKEATHLEGFSPETAWVTEAGSSKLDERLAIRPTSETIMYDLYSKWIRSWRDLPLKLNQWVNVVRWEKTDPKVFLRGREFLWQEGHTAFATKEEAEKEVRDIVNMYKEVLEEYCALPVTVGIKSPKETFAGAEYTRVTELVMPDGKTIQGPDCHHLGQKFSTMFDITFLDKDGEKKYVWQNSWGFTTRVLGIMFGIHGDDKGLILPPKIAPIQVVIVPIFTEKDKPAVLKEADELKIRLEEDGIRTYIDSREDKKPGWKFNYWELKGVPIRVEIGTKDLANDEYTVVRRDTLEKIKVSRKDAIDRIIKLFDVIHNNMYQRAKELMESKTKKVDNYEDFKKYVNGNRILTCWCGNRKCEDEIKEETGARVSCIPDEQEIFCNCVKCGEPAKYSVYFAKVY